MAANTIRLPNDLQAKVKKIAKANHLSINDVIRICISQTIPRIEEFGITILPPEAKSKAA